MNLVLNTYIKDLAYSLYWVVGCFFSFSFNLILAVYSASTEIIVCPSQASYNSQHLLLPSLFSAVEEDSCGRHPKMAKLGSRLVSPKLRSSQLLPEGLGHAVFLIVWEADTFHSLKTGAFLSQYTIPAFRLYIKCWKTREWSGRGSQWFTPASHCASLSVSGMGDQKLMDKNA